MHLRNFMMLCISVLVLFRTVLLSYKYMFLIRIKCLRKPWSASQVENGWSSHINSVLEAWMLPSVYAK